MNIYQGIKQDKGKRIIFRNLENKLIFYRYTKINALRLGFFAIKNLPKNTIKNHCHLTAHLVRYILTTFVAASNQKIFSIFKFMLFFMVILTDTAFADIKNVTR